MLSSETEEYTVISSHEEADKKSLGNLEQNCESQEEFSVQDAGVAEKQHRPRILMGRSALLGVKKDVNDSLVVRDLVVDKYKDVMNHYKGRFFKRRTSKERLRTYDDDSLDSPAGTPSSVGTPNSYSSQESQDDINPFLFQEGDNISCGSSGRVQERFKFLMSPGDEDEHKIIMVPTADDECSDTSVITTDLDEDLDDMNFDDEKYDPQKFLRDALGSEEEDEFTEESSIRSNIHPKQKSQSNFSINSQNASSLLTRINSFCGSLKHSVKKKLHSRKFSFRRSTQSLNSMCSLDLIHENSEASRKEVLESELIKENSIILQILKALKYCTSVKQFVSSIEHLEAERILLVASCRKEAITEEINKLNFETNEDKTDMKSSGTVELSNLIFFSNTETDLKTDNNAECVEHFVLVLRCNDVILASDVIKMDSEGHIKVKKNFKFGNLQADFMITVCIYSMKVRGPFKTYSHESKYHLKKESSSPSSKFRLSRYRDPSRQKVVEDVSSLKPSSFILRGRYDIRCSDLSSKQFKMYNVPMSSSLNREFTADLRSDWKFNLRRSGFLNIDIDCKGCWNRRWCVLKNSDFEYWNYPSEETSLPICTINLTECATRFVDLADRSECARGKTLLLPVLNENHPVKKYFLSADSLAEMEQWKKDLNYVVSNLEIWKCARCNALK